jgi:hypothetical protein
MHTDTHAPSGTRTHDPSVWASSCLRPRDRCDRLHMTCGTRIKRDYLLKCYYMFLPLEWPTSHFCIDSDDRHDAYVHAQSAQVMRWRSETADRCVTFLAGILLIIPSHEKFYIAVTTSDEMALLSWRIEPSLPSHPFPEVSEKFALKCVFILCNVSDQKQDALHKYTTVLLFYVVCAVNLVEFTDVEVCPRSW